MWQILVIIAALAVGLDSADICEEIENTEFVCIDDHTLGFCARTNGVWQSQAILNCGYGFECDKELRTCSVRMYCPTYTATRRFQCQAPGRYPHPFSCQHYIECDEDLQDTCNKCPSGRSYSAKYGSCIADYACKQPLFQCNVDFEISAWPENPNIYYVCRRNADNPTEWDPVLFKCSDGKIFDGKLCVKASSSMDTTIVSAPTTTTTAGTLINCVDGRLAADPSDCHRFYSCAFGTYERFTCAGNTIFDEAKQQCIFGSC